MFHVVFMEPPDDVYVATENEAIDLIKSRITGAVFAAWRGRSLRVYRDEKSRNLGESEGAKADVCCCAFVIQLIEPSGEI
jgi:hypothetical protein